MEERQTLPAQESLGIAREFMSFMMEYYALIRRHVVEANPYRIHSHGFSMLYTLRESREHPITMTRFAEEMGITKQQLTKLVNDLEKQRLVRRLHSRENRRQVYIEITEEGKTYLDGMIGAILGEILGALSEFGEADQARILEHSEALLEIFRRDAEHCRRREEEAAQENEPQPV